jgi:hypothetical protein
MALVYVLRLTSNKFYVGVTTNIDRRIYEHSTGRGSVWTSKFKPIETAFMSALPIEPNYFITNMDETLVTLAYMEKYGIDNVRGGPFTQLDISRHIPTIQAIINTRNNNCFRCNRAGHFIDQCSWHRE